jgi:hypothetical protein
MGDFRPVAREQRGDIAEEDRLLGLFFFLRRAARIPTKRPKARATPMPMKKPEMPDWSGPWRVKKLERRWNSGGRVTSAESLPRMASATMLEQPKSRKLLRAQMRKRCWRALVSERALKSR